MRMGRRRIWTLGRMLAANSRTERRPWHPSPLPRRSRSRQRWLLIGIPVVLLFGRGVKSLVQLATGRYASGSLGVMICLAVLSMVAARRTRRRSGVGAGCLRWRSSDGTWSASWCCGGSARPTTSRCPSWRSARSSLTTPEMRADVRGSVAPMTAKTENPDLGHAPASAGRAGHRSAARLRAGRAVHAWRGVPADERGDVSRRRRPMRSDGNGQAIGRSGARGILRCDPRRRGDGRRAGSRLHDRGRNRRGRRCRVALPAREPAGSRLPLPRRAAGAGWLWRRG